MFFAKINISMKRTLFWDLFKKFFFAHFSKNINISRNVIMRTLFWDHFEKNCFYTYIRKYQHFEPKDVILRPLWKDHFMTISPKKTFFRSLWKNCIARFSKNINISRKLLFFEITCSYHRKYKLSTKRLFFRFVLDKKDFHFKKNFYWPYVQKCQHFEENYVIVRLI